MARKPVAKARVATKPLTRAERQATTEFLRTIRAQLSSNADKIDEQAKTIASGKAALAELETRFAALAQQHAALRETAAADATKAATLGHDLEQEKSVTRIQRVNLDAKQRTIDALNAELEAEAERNRDLARALRDTEHALGLSRIEAINLAESDAERRLRARHDIGRVNAETAR